ncbi:hypothetical protein MR532_03485 [bacterium]|nr:hypothetical protein [bacterium]
MYIILWGLPLPTAPGSRYLPPGLDEEAYAHGVGQEVKEALALCHVGREDP